MGRGGQLISLEQFVAMGLAVAVVIVLFLFVESRTESSGYFMDLQSKDMALLSDLVVASPGDLVVTYDNIKQGLDLKYSFRNGLVTANLVQDGKPVGEGQRWSYGTYEDLNRLDVSFEPVFLTFIKNDDQFLVRESLAYSARCEGERSGEELSFNLKGEDGIHTGTHKVLSSAMTVPPLSDKEGIIIEVIRANEVSITYGGVDGAYLSCLIADTYAGFTGEEIVPREGYPHILITHNESAEFIGQVIGQAVVVYAK